MSISVKKLLLCFLLLLVALLMAAQQQVSIAVSLEGKEKRTVYRNEPLLVTVHLNSPKAAAEAQWNREAEIGIAGLKSQYENQSISLEKFNAETEQIEKEMKKNSRIVLGSAETPASQLLHLFLISKQGDTVNIPAKLINGKTIPDQLVLDAGSAYGLLYGIPGTEIRQLKPGKYWMTASISSYTSNRLALTILSYPIPRSVSESIRMQTKLGKFALLYGDTDSALVSAKYITDKHPSSVDGWVLLGDVYVEKERFKEARKAFETALQNFQQQFPRATEPPEYILSRLEELKGKTDR